jgi:hypothetical protein
VLPLAILAAGLLLGLLKSGLCVFGCRIVSLPANLDFMIFNHRGKVFPLEMDLKLKH